MFDIGWPELMLVVVAALLVIGPKELPGAIRTVASVVRKLRGMAREFQSGLDDIARDSGIGEVKDQFNDMVDYDPKAALDAMADNEREFDYGDTANPTTGEPVADGPVSGNSILADDPAAAGEDGEEDDATSRPAAGTAT